MKPSWSSAIRFLVVESLALLAYPPYSSYLNSFLNRSLNSSAVNW